MALSQHVKKLATDAIAGKETTDWIRERGSESVTGPFPRCPENGDSEPARRQAMDAVSQSETMRQIRLVSVNEIDTPMPTPERDSLRLSGNAALRFHWKGYAAAAPQDGIERDYGR